MAKKAKRQRREREYTAFYNEVKPEHGRVTASSKAEAIRKVKELRIGGGAHASRVRIPGKGTVI